MKIRCIQTEPSEEQVRRLGTRYYRAPQNFGIKAGEEYLVFGLAFLDGEPWVDILLIPNNLLHSVPLCLFEIVDRRVSKYWAMRLKPEGGLAIRPPSILDNPYYFDDLSEGVSEVVNDFRNVYKLLEDEGQEHVHL